jgi:hypothetical protein
LDNLQQPVLACQSPEKEATEKNNKFRRHSFATYPRSFAYTTPPYMRGKGYATPSAIYADATAPDSPVADSTPFGFLEHST